VKVGQSTVVVMIQYATDSMAYTRLAEISTGGGVDLSSEGESHGVDLSEGSINGRHDDVELIDHGIEERV
jgi:hypothetical protein